MSLREFFQPRENETDLPNWRKSIHKALYGSKEDDTEGTLDGKNIKNITDPTDSAEDLAELTVKFNLLLGELRDTLGLFG